MVNSGMITENGHHIQIMICQRCTNRRASYFDNENSQWYCKECIKEKLRITDGEWNRMLEGETEPMKSSTNSDDNRKVKNDG